MGMKYGRQRGYTSLAKITDLCESWERAGRGFRYALTVI